MTYSELAGEALREHVWPSEDPADEAVERARLVAAATAPVRRRGRTVVAAVSVVSIVAIATLALFLGLRPSAAPRLITFSVGSDGGAGNVGAYYAAPPAMELPVRFSEGSIVTVQPRGGVRIQHADISRVMLSVETGRTHFDVKPGTGATWHVAAGPYTLEVHGTSFELAWDASNAMFELVMRSGSVRVRGPGVETGVVLKDQQTFTNRVITDVSRSAGSPASAPAPTGSSPTRRAALAGPVVEPEESWNALAAQGEYAQIVRSAEKRGIEASINKVNVDELRALADAARFTGRTELAERTLLAIRSRFARTSAATRAAFIMGRMLDNGGDQRTAVDWYERYLAERGPLAAEAAGRRMIALWRLGDAAAARKAAREYSKRFPAGPYIQQARDLESR